jgi:hypothetical protein
VGPVVVDHYEIPQQSPNSFQLRLFLRNDGLNATASVVRTEMSTTDTNVVSITPDPMYFGNIAPGQIKNSAFVYTVNTQNNPANVDFNVKILSNDWEFWRDSLTAVIITAIAHEETNIPTEFKLNQNYPNPFNPITTIEFDLPKTGEVSLKIYNILGEEVITLVSERLSAGSYSYEWEASNLASGVYLYRLQTGDYVETKKMILMR